MVVAARRIVGSLAAGVAAIGLIAAQPLASDNKDVVEPASLPDPVRQADPLGAMLTDARAAYAKYRDYTCVFTRQERLKKGLGAQQVAEMKVRVKPFCISVRFARPQAVAGMAEVYDSNSRIGKMRYRPAGAQGLNGFRLVSLDDPKILAETRHPVTEMGIHGIMDVLTTAAAREKTLGNALEVFTADYQFAGKTVTRYEVFARRAHAHRYAYRMLVYVDKETKLPVRFEAYDAPKPGTTVGDLLESYSYTDVKFNVGLGDSAFE